MGVGESEETFRIFCGHVNFPEMNGGISVYGGTNQIIIKRVLIINNNALQN